MIDQSQKKFAQLALQKGHQFVSHTYHLVLFFHVETASSELQPLLSPEALNKDICALLQSSVMPGCCERGCWTSLDNLSDQIMGLARINCGLS